MDPVEPGQHILEGVNEEYFGNNDDGEDGMVLVIMEVDDDGWWWWYGMLIVGDFNINYEDLNYLQSKERYKGGIYLWGSFCP